MNETLAKDSCLRVNLQLQRVTLFGGFALSVLFSNIRKIKHQEKKSVNSKMNIDIIVDFKPEYCYALPGFLKHRLNLPYSYCVNGVDTAGAWVLATS